ncbi:sugar transferase [Aurantiacibacter aquimixticola]|uniref:Sugar transferase n=1 Tax=Aurantiacibacter aquimixticola TaxID=1958945 RepID=A0A419RSJ5_9SPHN|nr:sugar transferase [Aurantiacibacter aquimixticola]RJY08724.1 sugar transferase [Aurantiacibacter aquimixticola]
MKRLIDITGSLAGLIALLPLMLVAGLLVRLDSEGPALHFSKRFSRDQSLFAMPKFRSMRTDTPELPTHLLTDAKAYITRVGRILRSTSLDELPQLWSVLKGDMSLVGPRPALFNQHDLMAMRVEAGVAGLRPGITGWAQINGRDELSLERKVALEREYLERQSVFFDFKILFLTVYRAVRNDGIAH